MSHDQLIQWGVSLFIFALLMGVCALAFWPKDDKPEEYTYPHCQDTTVETRPVAEARAIIEQCWPDEVA
jgi:hypothetical protein